MSKLAYLASNYSDGILIAMFLGTAPVTIFTLTQKLSSAAFMFVAKVGPMTIPGLAELMGKPDPAVLRAITLRMTRLLTRVGILFAALILVLNHRFVSLWTGEATFGGTFLTALLAWGILRDTVIRNLSAFLFASGELRGWGVLSAAEAVTKIGIAVALIPAFGIVAPVIGTAIAELLTAVYTPRKLATLTGVDIRLLFTSGMAPSVIRSIPMLVVLPCLVLAVPISWRWLGVTAIAAGGIATNLAVFDFRTLAQIIRRAEHRVI